MKTIIESSPTCSDRKAAMLWMKNKYKEYPDNSIISSSFSDNGIYTIAYIIINQDKLTPPNKHLIKIT